MELENHEYKIQGRPVEDIVYQYGTPLYIYDAETIRERYNELCQAFDGMNFRIKYAAKALTNSAVLKLIRKLGAGLDAVSLNEVRLGLRAGFPPEEIMYTPNCVSFEEIRRGIELGVKINIDNLPFLERLGEEYGNEVPCCIRLNPHIVAGGHDNIQTGHIGSKFGISIHHLDDVVETVNKYDIPVSGLHVHTGSDILDADVFLESANLVFDAARHFPDLDFLDFGSGFKVAYRDDDVTTDIQAVGEKMKKATEEFCKNYGKDVEIWFEPGKYLVSEAGTFLVHVNLIKPTPSCVFLGVDSGFNHLIRPMFYDAYHRIINISNPGGHEKVYTVVGYICETDTFAYNRKIAEARTGDTLAFKNAGAYGFMMSSNFNSRLRPAEVLMYDGIPYLIRKRESFDDLIRNEVEIDLE